MSERGTEPSTTIGANTRWMAMLGISLLAFGAACRLFRYWLDFPIWIDEASLALNFAERDYRGLLRELNYLQVAPILFLWAEKAVFDLFGPSTQALRVLPLIAGIGGLVLFWRLARKTLPLPAAVFAIGLLAVAGWPIELASSIKPYSLDLCVAVALMWLTERASRDFREVRWLALIVPFAVCLSYPAVFVAGAASLLLLPAARGERSLSSRGWFVAFNLLLVGVFAAHLLLVGREKDPQNPPDLLGYMKGFWRYGFPSDRPLEAVWWAVRVHFGRMFAGPVQVNGAGAVGFALVATGAVSLFRSGRGRVALLCLLPFALHFVAALLRRYPYGMHPRLEQHLAPGYCILCGAGLADLIRRLARSEAMRDALVCAGAGALFLIGVVVSMRDAKSPWHDEQALWARQVVGHLRDEMRAEDRIFPTTPLAHVCLRWQLLPLADRVADEQSITGSGSVWLIAVYFDERPVDAPEPTPRFPGDGELGECRRFRGTIIESKTRTNRFFCDVYRCSPEQAAAMIARP